MFLCNVAVFVSTWLSFVAGNPVRLDGRQTNFTPGTLNNTQEFYITLSIGSGLSKYNGWQSMSPFRSSLHLSRSRSLIQPVEAYHTGAGLGDPVFVPPYPTNSSSGGSRAYLNSTNLQFDVGPYPFSANGSPGDTNYARWEPVTISAGYGSAGFEIFEAGKGIVQTNEEFDGWLVCEWYHGVNLPQLFQLIRGFDEIAAGGEAAGMFPCSCARAVLTASYF